MSETLYDVIVVGSGISGLYAGRCLKGEGLKFVILEAQDRIGGRTLTSRGEFGYADMGGAYFGRQQTKVVELVKELGLEFYNVPTQGKTTMKLKGRISHYEGDIPKVNNFLELFDLVGVIKELDRLSQQIPLIQPWLAPSAGRLDALSVTEFLDKFCWTSFAKTLIDVGLSTVFALPSSNVSLLYALHLIKSCGGTKALFELKEGLQEMKLIGGSDSVSHKMAEELEMEIQLKSRVTQISQEPDDIVLVRIEDGTAFKTKAVIVATSPAVLKDIKWLPSLPGDMVPFLELPQMDWASFKTITYYERPYWEEKGLNGSVVCDEGIVKIGFPDTKHDGKYPAIMGFVLGAKYQLMTPNERKDAIASHYAKLFGIQEMATPCGYLEKHWNAPTELQFSGPCVYTLPPKFLTQNKRFWGKTFGRVYFAGSESSPVFRGYMEGGIRAAALAVKEILFDFKLQPKNDYSGLEKPVPYLELTRAERLIPGVTHLLWGVCGVLIAVTLYCYFSMQVSV